MRNSLSDKAFPGPPGSERTPKLKQADELYSSALERFAYLMRDQRSTQLRGKVGTDELMPIARNFFDASVLYKDEGELASFAQALRHAVTTHVLALNELTPDSMTLLNTAGFRLEELGLLGESAITWAEMHKYIRFTSNASSEIAGLSKSLLARSIQNFELARAESHQIRHLLIVMASTYCTASIHLVSSSREADALLEQSEQLARKACEPENIKIQVNGVSDMKPEDVKITLANILLKRLQLEQHNHLPLDNNKLEEAKRIIQETQKQIDDSTNWQIAKKILGQLTK